MNKNIKDIQKSEEVKAIERFIDLLNISPENEAVLVEKNRESPDFILKINDKIIGFELSEIIESKENIATDTSIKINALLFESIKDDSKYSFLNGKAINVRFFKDNDINQKIFSSIINQIKQFLFLKKDKILVKQIFHNNEFDTNYKLLKKIIKRITIFPISTEEPMIEISNRQAFSYSIEKDILKMIESKNKKLLKYRKNNKTTLNYYVLLLYIKNSSLYKIGSEVFKAKNILKECKKDINFDYVYLFDFDNIDNNEFLAVNQFSIIENNNSRRADIVIFINGLPLAAFELKNPLDVSLSIKTSFNQFKTYINELPSLFEYNEMLIITDGIEARAGTLSSNFERFMPWKSIDGLSLSNSTQLDSLLKGMFNKKTILDLLRGFIVFEDNDEGYIKKLAAYHQYYAVNKALDKTIISSSKNGDGRSGVIWHTQGSGKSLTMVFYAAKLVNNLNNPTIVVLTDRNDLDDQLFNTFSSCSGILRQTPIQATSREELKSLLKVSSGGIIFTTIQKFFPEKVGSSYPLLSDRKNIVVIADEAHRSQYDFIDGFARHLRDGLSNASYIGFTGTPIEKEDRSTPEIFGNYIDIYDIERAIEDGSTVPIYYESRLAKLNLNEDEIPKVDPKFEEVTENEEEEVKHKLKSKWARLEAIVGTEKRIKNIAAEIVYHFEQRQKAINSKAIIVCMSRRICVDLYDQIIKLRPNWNSDNINEGKLKVIMTGQASDPTSYQRHIHPRDIRRKLAAMYLFLSQLNQE